MSLNGSGWSPTKLTRFVQSFGSAMNTSFVDTDAGQGYLKGVGNPAGPHQLACEWVGTSLADWFGARTFEFSQIEIGQEDQVPLHNGGRLTAGRAFITKADTRGFPWSGAESDLQKISDVAAFSHLVTLDTWTLNCDRYSPDGSRINKDNVFLTQVEPRSKRLALIAMDFSHSYSCGHQLAKSNFYLERAQEAKVYGYFPSFKPFVSAKQVGVCARRLGEFSDVALRPIMAAIPPEWEVPGELIGLWKRMILDRARFLSANLEALIDTQERLALKEA